MDFQSQEKIQERAYLLWKQRGCPDGSPDEDWFRAKWELSTHISTHISTPIESTKEKTYSEKIRALARKEGAKKGQDLSGLEDMGGVHYFHVALENCEGSWELVEEAMKGANTEVDPKAEDRSGGAQNIGKAFLSASVDRLCIYLHVPSKLSTVVPIEEWFNVLVEASGATVLESPFIGNGVGGGFAKAEVLRTGGSEVFPLKLRDAAIGLGFAYLRSKGVVPEDDNSSEMEMEDCGVEW